MQSLLQIVADFRVGKLDQGALLTQVGSLLNDGGENVDAILSDLQQEHAREPLPLSTFVALRKHLLAASAPKTSIMPPPRTEILAAILGSAPPAIASPTPTSREAEEPQDSTAKKAIGAVLAGRFRLVEFVGEGGTSRLYKALDLRKAEAGADDPHVAVKILTLPFNDTLDGLAVLHRETEGLQTLAHPNIVRVIDCDRDGDTVFMTMEFIRGKTLHTLLRGSRFSASSPAERLQIIEGMASAVEFAHSKSIVHGDLTPGNVMITATAAVKVIDFGIARMFGQPVDRHSRRSESRGELTGVSPSYASPEALELREPDPRDDVYSLACIAWELLTGSHPFGGRNAKAARDAGLRLPRDKTLARTQYAALSRALAFEREERTPTVRQFMAEFAAAKNRRVLPYVAGFILAIGIGAYIYFTRPTQLSSTQVVQQSEQPNTARSQVTQEMLAASTAPKPGAVFRDCPTCPLMTVVPAGEFLQGAAMNDANAQRFELPRHRVGIANPFAASRTEITVGEFAEFAQSTNRPARDCAAYDGAWKTQADVHWNNAVAQQTSSHPVSCVSWQDASEYVEWLSTRTGQHYRLPSASEWEYAARAGSTADRAWPTDADACANANIADQSATQRYPGWTAHRCNDHYVNAAPVGSYAANAFGLYDMLGNVFEWVADCWNETYANAPVDGSARRDGDCAQHEMRGGSWFTAPQFVRFAYRNRFANDYRSTSVGFRVVREMTP